MFPIRPLTFLVLAIPFFAAQAQVDIDNMSLDELMNTKVVTASKREQDTSLAPATIRVISAKEIQTRGYKDLKDIFRDLPGFDFSENLTGEVRSLAITRGILGANKLLILKDGKRLNALTGERLVLGNNIPLFNAERIEIMYGPGSVLYGADAYAGVVNIITKNYDHLAANGYHNLVDIAYGTENRFDIGLMTGAKIADSIDTTWSARLFQSDGIDPTHFDEFDSLSGDYHQPIRDYELYGRTRLGNAQLTVYRQDATEPGGPSTLPVLFSFNGAYVWQQIQNKIYLDHELTGENWQLSSTFGYEDYEIGPQSNFYYTTGPAYKYGRNMAVFIEEQLDYNFSESTTLVTGFQAEKVDAFAKGANLSAPYSRPDLVDEITYPNDPAIPDEYRGKTLQFGVRPYSGLGVFSEITHEFSERSVINFGARYDYNSDYYGVFNPRIGYIYKISDKTITKLLYGSAYIKPSRYMAYEHWNAANLFGYYPNPDLAPEQLSTFQWNIRHSISSDLIVSLNTYYNMIENLIIPKNGTWNTNVNMGDPQIKGAELLFDWQANSQIRSYLYYSYLDATRADGSPMNKVARHKANAGLTYTADSWSFSPSLRWSDKIAYLDQAATQGISHMDGFLTLDASLRMTAVAEGLDIYITGRNILDAQYYAASPFGEAPEGWLMEKAPQPGRTGELGLTYKF